MPEHGQVNRITGPAIRQDSNKSNRNHSCSVDWLGSIHHVDIILMALKVIYFTIKHIHTVSSPKCQYLA